MSELPPCDPSAWHPWKEISAPLARKEPVEVTTHGRTQIDEYAWLRDPAFPEVTDPDILGYLNAENDYLAEILGPLAPLRRRLYDEMRGRIAEEDDSVPARRGEWYYLNRYKEGQQYPLHCRRKGSEDGPESVILDENAVAEGKAYCRVGDVAVSHDHRLMAWAVDYDGSERFELRIRDLETGEDLPDLITGTAGYAIWSKDNRTLFYSLLDEHHRPNRVYRHHLGEDPARDVLIYEETDPGFWLSLSESSDEELIFINSGDKDTAEIRWLRADDPDAEPKLFLARKTGHDYDLDHYPGAKAEDGSQGGGQFWIRTNDTHRNFRIVTAADDNAAPENWQEVIPASDAVYQQGFLLFRSHMVLIEREDGLRHARICRLPADGSDMDQHRVPLPDAAYTLRSGNNPEFDQTHVRLGYSSMGRPDQVLDYDFEARTLTVRKERKIPSGFDSSAYVTERLHAEARDGVAVPLSLVRRKDVEPGPETPLYLYVYGAYGSSIDPYFSTNRISLLDRGFIFVIAHVRGGSDMGRWWYEDGKMENKTNTFTDLVAVAQHLVDQGYTAPGQITISGGSAGGMTVGATMNLRPDLFRAVIAAVPFVDVLNTMLDSTLPLTPPEYTEWGNPEADPEVYDRILGYCPYSNSTPGTYPHLFVSAGISDPRVTYWEPAKWVARIRAMRTDDNLTLLRTNMDAGHGGASGRFDSLKELAEEYAFLLLVYGKLSAEDFGESKRDPWPEEG